LGNTSPITKVKGHRTSKVNFKTGEAEEKDYPIKK
jgi:hypothetical protein